MQNYELLFILPGTLAESELPALVEKTKSTVEQNGAKELAVFDMGKSRLAYPIKHIRYGYFYVAHFSAEAKEVVAIQAKLRLMTELLRAVITKFDQKTGVEPKINFGNMMPAQAVAEEKTSAPVFVSVEKQAEEVAANVTKAKNEEEEPKKKSRIKKEDKKINLDEIDKKLDEILEIDLNKV